MRRNSSQPARRRQDRPGQDSTQKPRDGFSDRLAKLDSLNGDASASDAARRGLDALRLVFPVPEDDSLFDDVPPKSVDGDSRVTVHSPEGRDAAIWQDSPPPTPPHNVADLHGPVTAKSFAATLWGGGHLPARERLHSRSGDGDSGGSVVESNGGDGRDAAGDEGELAHVPSDEDFWSCGGGFLERFEIEQSLGEGGFGTVLRAYDRKLGRPVAVKIFDGSIIASDRLQEQFLAEVRTMAELKHPGIVPIHDAAVEGALWYLVMEYCSGPTLAAWIAARHHRPVDPRLAAEIVVRLAEAVHYAHSRGRLHRDIKPSNVLLEPDELADRQDFGYAVKLSDFGLAKSLSPNQRTPSPCPLPQSEREGIRIASEHMEASRGGPSDVVVAGTPRYMAPEQAAGRDGDITVQTDVYGLGAVLYELLTGRPPFGEVSVDDWWRLVATCEPAPVRAAGARVPLDLASICERCLKRDPEVRYGSALALRQDLESFLQGCPVAARPSGRPARIVRRIRRHPLVSGLVAALLIMLAAGSASVVWQWRRAEYNAAAAQAHAARAEQSLNEAEEAILQLVVAIDEASFWREESPLQGIDAVEQVGIYYDRMIRQKLARKPSKAMQAAAQSYLARIATLRGDLGNVQPLFRESLRLWHEVVREDPTNETMRHALSLTLYHYGMVLRYSFGIKDGLWRLGNRKLHGEFSADMPVDHMAMRDYLDLLETKAEQLQRRDKASEARELRDARWKLATKCAPSLGSQPGVLASHGLGVEAYRSGAVDHPSAVMRDAAAGGDSARLGFDGTRDAVFVAEAGPTAWIEVDLQRLRDVSAVTLYVEGSAQAQHRVYVSKSPIGEDLTAATLVRRFSGRFSDGQRLHGELLPIKARYVQIRTVRTSGRAAWEECEVYAAP